MDRISHRGHGSFNVEGGVALLFDQERVPMVRMATLMVGSSALAEEVVQDAFAGVSQRWADVDRPGAYLRRSVVNGCAQILRRRSVEARYNALDEPAGEVELPSHLVELQLGLPPNGSIQAKDEPHLVPCSLDSVRQPDREARSLEVSEAQLSHAAGEHQIALGGLTSLHLRA